MYHWLRFSLRAAPSEQGPRVAVDRTPRRLRIARSEAVSSQERSQSTSIALTSRSWPATCTLPAEHEATCSNIFTAEIECNHSWSITERASRSTVSTSTSTLTSYRPRIQAPPRCRLPPSMRFTALLMYISFVFLLITTTSATPLSIPHTRIHLHNRQSIPDKTGNTGNEPAPIAPDAPPVIPSSTPATVSITSIPTSSTISSSAIQPTSTLMTGSNGNSNNGGGDNGLGLNPNPGPPVPDLRITTPQLGLSTGALAGIIGGGVVFLLIVVVLCIFIYRRTRKPEIDEIPIRRSRLGSRLGRRMFGSLSNSRSTSRADSRSSSRASLTGDAREKQAEAGWLDKGTISRPKAAWLENGLLSVPRPAFMKEEKDRVNEGEKWVVSKGTISGPRPGRPASAEPLGRLSGMGMGMGYLK